MKRWKTMNLRKFYRVRNVYLENAYCLYNLILYVNNHTKLQKLNSIPSFFHAFSLYHIRYSWYIHYTKRAFLHITF